MRMPCLHEHSRSTAVIAGNAGHFPLWLTQSDARYLCGQRRRAFFCAADFLPYLSYPPKRKSYVLSTSVLDSISLDFWINEKAATLHHERQEYFLLLGFAMLCNGFGIQNHAAIHQPKRDSIHSAAVSLVHWLTFHSSIYVLI